MPSVKDQLRLAELERRLDALPEDFGKHLATLERRMMFLEEGAVASEEPIQPGPPPETLFRYGILKREEATA